jgi:EAL domain-containing protein (putative c-di-GMP-specific phosphodiesterase class I)
MILLKVSKESNIFIIFCRYHMANFMKRPVKNEYLFHLAFFLSFLALWSTILIVYFMDQCSQHGMSAARLTLELSESILFVSKTFSPFGVHS